MDLRMYQRILSVQARDHTLNGGPCGKCGDLDGCWYRKVESVYVASSWRNETQPFVVKSLRDQRLSVYDFRDEEGFRWSEIDTNWEQWTPEEFREGVSHPIANRGFDRDLLAMQSCDACIMVQPCGVSAALELGWFVGQGKPAAVLLQPGERFEPELMLKLVGDGAIFCTLEEAVEWFNDLAVRKNQSR